MMVNLTFLLFLSFTSLGVYSQGCSEDGDCPSNSSLGERSAPDILNQSCGGQTIDSSSRASSESGESGESVQNGSVITNTD